MTTQLTEVAYQARRAINYAILAVIAYIILRIFWTLLVTLFFVFFPPNAPPPNHRFGILPALQFPLVASPSGQLTFRLETISGSVPKASASATIYFMPKQAANLLALTNTQTFAAQLGLDTNPIQESKNVYRFTDPKYPQRRLRYDIVSNNFILRYVYEQDPSIFVERNLPSDNDAKQETIAMLDRYKLYVDDFKYGTSKVTYLRLNGSTLAPASSLSQADAVRVDITRRGIGNTSIITPYPGEGEVAVIFSGSKDPQKHIIQFAYTYWPIDQTTTATYALKTSGQAWEELQSGQGYIARYPTGGTSIVVRNIYVAYYDSFEPQTYLQPVFVFEGDDGFVGYVPAVAKPWTQ